MKSIPDQTWIYHGNFGGYSNILGYDLRRHVMYLPTFGENCYFHIQGYLGCLKPENRGSMLEELSVTSEGLSAEDGGNKFLRHFDNYLPVDMMSYPNLNKSAF